ncbi:hypothetical protein [Candidatus Methanomassiliicoccus intestinalis]|uniref:hypothetical protein n=1 Tax=Candidatus Methanomassiliicoccus intestinalis TaxID=1406512 RepID=UPI0037DC331E
MNKKIAAVIIAVVIIIAAVAVVFFYEDSKGNDASPLTGEWKLADEYGVNDEGNFITYDETADNAIISISKVKDDLFYGKYLNEEIAGAYINGHVFFQATVNNEKVNFEGHLDNGVLSLTYAYGADGKTAIHYAIFTKDTYEAKDAKYTNLQDLELSVVSGYFCSANGVEEFIGDAVQGLKITAQEGGAFTGTMDQIVGEDNVPLTIRGIIYADTTTQVKFIDQNGHSWDMNLQDNVAVVNNIMISDIGINENDLSALERIYTANNSEVTNLPNLEKLIGDWIVSSAHTLDTAGKTSEETGFASLSFINSYNSLAAGVSTHDNNLGKVVAYQYVDPENGEELIKIVSQYGDELITGYGWLSNDNQVLNLIEIHTDAQGKQTAEHSIFNKNAANDKLLGDWKVAQVKGSSQGAELKEYTRSEYPLLSDYDLTIDKAQLSLLSGTYRDMEITGAITGGMVITIEVINDNGRDVLKGFLLENDVLVLYSVAYQTVGDATTTSTWCIVYTKSGELVDYTMTQDDIPELQKNWLMVSGESYDGTSHELSGSNLNIAVQDGNWINCQMEQTVGTEIVNKTVTGFIFNVNGLMMGTLIDENGNYWYITIKDSVLAMHSVMYSELSEIAGQVVAVERVYTPDGKDVELPPAPSLENTKWQTKVMYSITKDGKITVAEEGFAMNVGTQNGNLLTGTEVVADVLTGGFSACMYESVNSVAIEKLENNLGGVMAHGFIYGDIINFTSTSFGVLDQTSIVILEKI